MSSIIYCISGMGADERVFNNLELSNHQLKYIPWIQPLKNEGIQEYAKRMSLAITDPNPVILGVSFGGIMAIEIAKQRNFKNIIIISSVKSKNEIPGWMKATGSWKLDKIFPLKPFPLINSFLNDRLGVSNEEEKKLVDDYRGKTDPVYLNWAVHQVLNWQNEFLPNNLLHIQGSNDKIFPVKHVNATYVINGGTHLMIYNRAAEISKIIDSEV